MSRFVLQEQQYRTEEPWRLTGALGATLWKKVVQSSRPLREYLSATNRTITTGSNAAFVGACDYMPSLGVEANTVRPLSLAKHLKRYAIEDSDSCIVFPYEADSSGQPKLVDLAAYPGLSNYFEGIRDKLEQRRWFGQTIVQAGMPWYGYLYLSRYLFRPKLLFPKIAATTLFVYDPIGDVILLEPAYLAIVSEGNNPMYLLACLNSNLLTKYIRQVTTTLSGGFLELQVQYVEGLPIRRIAFTTPPERRDTLAEQARTLYERCIAERSHEGVLGFVEHHLSQQPEEADVVHDLLTYLAERMIALNKDKQAEQKRLLGWLEGELRIRPDKEGKTGLDSLTGKSKLQNYLGDYQKSEGELAYDALMDVLYKNRGRLGVSVTDSLFAHRLQEEYERSLGVLRPIKAQLALTDSLIDAVVYRLYGLTEEEIAIVEGSDN